MTTTPVLAHYDKGRWVVPVGSVRDTNWHPCDDCGRDVCVLTVNTARGTVVMADDLYAYASDDDGDLVVWCEECWPARQAADA